MFCENCETKDAVEKAAIQNEQEVNAGADMEKTMSGLIGLTSVMTIFTAVIILVYGFEDDDSIVASITAVVLSVIVCGVKWFIEINGQMRWFK
ncbi:MAG: hypothetical protein FWF87_03865 [Synergistaceae bacterium]|nr:hypothetical protein [Synergistaceae bacterium]